MTTNTMQLYGFIYLFIPSQIYMFRAMFSPITKSTWLYLQHLVMSTDVAADINVGGRYKKL